MIGATISMAVMALLFVIFGVVGATEKCDGNCVGCGAGVCDNKIEGGGS